MSKNHRQNIKTALQLLREARNNMDRDDFLATVRECCKDTKLRDPLISAWAASLEPQQKAIRIIEESVDKP